VIDVRVENRFGRKDEDILRINWCPVKLKTGVWNGVGKP